MHGVKEYSFGYLIVTWTSTKSIKGGLLWNNAHQIVFFPLWKIMIGPAGKPPQVFYFNNTYGVLPPAGFRKNATLRHFCSMLASLIHFRLSFSGDDSNYRFNVNVWPKATLVQREQGRFWIRSLREREKKKTSTIEWNIMTSPAEE